MRVTPLGGAGGGAVVTHLDITAVKRAEFKLRSNERRSQTSIDASAEIFAILDEDGQILELSPRTAELLGLGPGQAVGSPALEWVHERERGAARMTFQALVARPGSRAELDVRVLDGRLRWRNLNLAAANHLLHPSVHGVVISGADITARRRAQIAHHLQPRLLELLPAGVVVTDSAGVIAYWNAHAEVLYGYSSDEVIGREIEHLGIGPADPAVVSSIFERVAAGQPWDGDYDSKRKDGRPISVYVTMQQIEDDETGFEGIVAAFVDISDRRQLEQDLAFRALHDPLTALPNKTLFLDHLDKALTRTFRRRQESAVLFLDLDDFKSVNDYHGQAAGDAILREAAALIGGAIRAEDILARTAGDEFAICCEDVGGVEEARAIADRIFEALSQPFDSASRTLFISASIGIALARETDHAGTLLRKASAAMNRAKELGKGHCELFDQDLDRKLQQRKMLELELRRALAEGELVVWYQPEVELESGRVIGAEALVRWEHPVRGLLPPADFLPTAEQTGLICEVDRWVLDVVLEQMAAWTGSDAGCPETISVNVSARELNETAFVERLTKGLARWEVEPSALCIEVTEGLLVEDSELGAALLTEVRHLGVKVAIDDFGTGYSSLRYLKRFPLDRLKIDRSFVRNLGSDPQDTAIVSAIVTMARALGLQVVVEGVETPKQLRQARELGCGRGQGYFWSRPLTAVAFADVIGRRLPAGAEQGPT